MEWAKQSGNMNRTNGSRVQSAERINSVVSEKQLISEVNFSNINANALMPNMYEKDPKTETCLISKKKENSSILSQLLIKNNNNSNPHNGIPNNNNISVTWNEDEQNLYSKTEHLNQSIIESELKPLRIILRDCMKATTDSTEVKQPSNMDRTNRSISLRKRPYTFKYRDDGESSSNVSDGEESFSDWEVDHLNANDTSSGMKSFKKARLTKRDCGPSSDSVSNQVSIAQDSVSNQVSIAPSVIHKSGDPYDLAKTSREKLVLNNSETFPPSSFMCSDCGKLFMTKLSFTEHKKDLLCVNQDDLATKEITPEIANSPGMPERNSRVESNYKNCTFARGKLAVSDHKSTALFSNTYGKDPKIGTKFVSKENLDTRVFHQLSKKVKNDINHSSNKITRELEYNPKDSSQKLFVCPVCQKIFQTSLSFYKHKKNTLCFRKAFILKFQCDICGKLFGNKSKLGYHKNTHTNAKPYKCEECDRCFNSASYRNAHYKEVHSKKDKDKKYLRYLCCFCGMGTPSIEHITAHEESHRLPGGASAVPMPFKCSHCPKSFISNFKLKCHLRGHGPYTCSQCPKKFSSSKSLEKHKPSHTNNEEFKCEICSKAFSRRLNLNSHRQYAHINTTVKFFCDICDKGFKRKSHIEQHMISHSDERPISCPKCNETFKRITHLKQHTAAFHGKGRKS